MRQRRPDGFTLIELLVTVAIIGIVAAIAIMSYLTAITRARQKRTMNDMRTIASAWEARATDVQTYVVSGAGYTFPASAVDVNTLVSALTPTYIREFPRYDGWNRAYTFGAEENENAKDYAIRSSGRDGLWEEDYTPGTTASPDCDIVFSNGSFVAYPAAIQTK